MTVLVLEDAELLTIPTWLQPSPAVPPLPNLGAAAPGDFPAQHVRGAVVDMPGDKR